MNNEKTTTLLLFILVVVLGSGGILALKRAPKHSKGVNSQNTTSTNAFPVSIEKIGGPDSELGILETSWPGEIISNGVLEIQPRREGTIVEWSVNIGQKVQKGQIIAKLSAPPAMPELTIMLAEQARMLAEARVDAKSQVVFSEEKKQQLLALQAALDQSRSENLIVLNTQSGTATASETLSQAKNAAIADRQKMNATLEQAISRELQLMTEIDIDPITFYQSGTPLNLQSSLGGINPGTRDAYLIALKTAIREIIADGNVETTGKVYFEAGIRLASASYANDGLTSDEIMEIRKMISMNQMTFLEAVKDYQMSKTELAKMETEYKLMLAEKEVDYSMQNKEVTEQISMLNRDIAMSNGKVESAQASYNTVAGTVHGGLSIVAPAAGIISSVMKKNGDFVEPGMPIATLNTGRQQDQFVRFKIPSNIRLPEPGATLTVARPGFPKDTRRVKLIGVGTALDMNGSYLADAKFIDKTDWPVNVSVRVFANGSVPSTLSIKLQALEWTSSGAAVWLIKDDNTITKKQIQTGRVLGEKIEVYGGTSSGDRYVAKLVPELKEGLTVREGEVARAAPVTEDPHGHNK